MFQAKQVLLMILQRESPRSPVACWSVHILMPLCLQRGHHLCRSATFSALELRNFSGFSKSLMFWSNRNNCSWQAFSPKCADSSYTVKMKDKIALYKRKTYKTDFPERSQAKQLVSSSLQKPALLQLLLPKPEGKTLNPYAVYLGILRVRTPSRCTWKSASSSFSDWARGCPHQMGLPVEQHFYISPYISTSTYLQAHNPCLFLKSLMSFLWTIFSLPYRP